MNRNLKITKSSISSKLFLKRILITLLTTTLFAGAIPQAANAATTTFTCSLGGTYTITDGVVKNSTDCAGELNISSTATSIAEYAFSGSSREITSITIPDSVTTIGYGAFANLDKVTSITISKNVSSMFANSFMGQALVAINVAADNPLYSSVDGVVYNKNKTTIVKFPEGKKFDTWNFPSTVTRIGFESFARNQSITKFNIPEGVTNIESYPWNDSRTITDVSIPSSVVQIDQAFSLSWNNTALKNINVADGNSIYSSVDGVLFNKNKSSLIRFPAGRLDENFNIPTSVETLEDWSITSALLLKTIIIPTSVKTIGAGVFSGTGALMSIDIPASVTLIDTWQLFFYNNALTSINVAASNPNYKSIDGVLFNKDGSVLVHYPKAKSGSTYVFPSHVRKLAPWSFAQTSFSTMIIPEGITHIGDAAFYYSSLKSITIPNSVGELGWGSFISDSLKSFKYCTNILTQQMLDSAGLNGKPNVCGLNEPGAPTIGTVTSTGANSASVAYSAPASNGGSAITSYTATSIPGGLIGTIEQAGSGTIEVSGLNPATSYTFTVVASNVVGDSVASAVSQSVTTNGVPGAPIIGKATATGSKKASVSFTAPASNGGSAINTYTAISTPGGITGYLQQEGSGTVEVTGLDPETSYTFKIIASNGYGNSAESVSSNEITTEPAFIEIPCGGTATYNVEDGVATGGEKCSGDLVLSNKVRTTGWNAFSGSSLTSITLPNSVKTISGYLGGWGQTKLFAINIPSSVETIDNNAFAGLKSLKSFVVDSTNPNFSSVAGMLYNKNQTKLISVPSGKDLSDFTILSTVTTIGTNAIYGNESLIKLTIPNGVTEIESTAIAENYNLRVIQLPKSIKTLGASNGSFIVQGNSRLFSISIDPENENFTSASGVLFDKDKTTLLLYPMSKTSVDYVVPSTVRIIRNGGFEGARYLANLTLPDKLIEIGESAFSATQSLENIIIPASVEKIGAANFINSSMLSNITVASANKNYSSVDGVLFNADKTSLISYPSSKPLKRYVAPSTVTKIEDNAFFSSKLISVELPNGLTEIRNYAFAYMNSLRSIRIPDTVKIIGYGAFRGSIKNPITIPDGVEKVEYDSIADPNDPGFIYCGSTLKSEDIVSQNSNRPNLCGKEVPSAPKNVTATAVDDTSVKVNFSAPEATGSDSITSYTVFSNAGDLATADADGSTGSIIVSGLKPSTRYTFTVVATNIAGDSVASSATNAVITSASSSSVTADSGTYTLPCGPNATYKIVNGVVRGGESCVGDLVIDSRATSIGENAFSESKLGALTLPNSITEIGNYTFWNSTITSINIPEKVTSIGAVFLGQAEKIKSISIPKSVKSIGSYPFYMTKALESFTVDPENENYVVVDGALLNNKKTVLISFPAASKISKLDIPATVVEIAEYAFMGSALTSISIPKDLAKITDAFGLNTSLQTITVDPANPNFSIVDGNIYNADKTSLLFAPADKSKSDLVIPDGITSVSSWIFSNLAKTLKTVSIPATLENIDSYWFYDSAALTSITVDSKNPNFTSIEGVLFNKDQTSLIVYPQSKSGDSYTFPKSVIALQIYGTPMESTLKTINIPETLLTINPGAFNGWASLVKINVDPANPNYTSVDGVLFDKDLKKVIAYPQGKVAEEYVIPEGVTSVAPNAFYGAVYLKSIKTPESLISIQYSAFDHAKSLKTIALSKNILFVDSGAFNQTSALGYLYCGTEYSMLEIGMPNSGLENMTNVCGKSLPGTVSAGTAKSISATSVTLPFAAPSSDGGSPIFSYTAISNTGATTTLKSSAASGEIVITGLSPATSYTFKLLATNLVGDSPTESAQLVSVSTLKLTATVEDFANMTAVFGATPLTVAAPKSNSDGAWSYSSSDPKVVAVNGSTLNMVKSGSVTITATQTATDMYSASTKKFTVEVKPYVLVKASKRTINVTVKGAKAVVKINGKAAKTGVNNVKAGKNVVTITVGGVKVYTKTFKIK